MTTQTKTLAQPIRLYLFVVALGGFLSYLTAYVRVNYLSSNSRIGQLTVSKDIPGTIPKILTDSSRYRFGVHYFGDFFEPFMKTLDHAPYASIQTGYSPSNYPPFGQALFYPFTWLPYHLSLLLFLFLTLCLVLIPFIYVLRNYPLIDAGLFLVLGVVSSFPLLFVLDRGNYWGFTIGLVLLAMLFADKHHFKTASILIGLAAALKILPVLLFLWLLKKTSIKNILIGIFVSVAVSIGSMALFSGDLIQNFTTLYHALRQIHGNPSGDTTYQAVNNSLLSLFTNLDGSDLWGINSLAHVITTQYISVVMAILVLSVGVVLWSSRNPSNEFASNSSYLFNYFASSNHLCIYLSSLSVSNSLTIKI